MTNIKRLAIIAFAVVATVLSGCSDPVIDGVKSQAPEFRRGVITLSNSCLAGFYTGNTDKLVHGPCGQ